MSLTPKGGTGVLVAALASEMQLTAMSHRNPYYTFIINSINMAYDVSLMSLKYLQ